MDYERIQLTYLLACRIMSYRFWFKMMKNFTNCKVSPVWMVHRVREDFIRYQAWVTPEYLWKSRVSAVIILDLCPEVLVQALSETYQKEMNDLACRCC